ncbi:UNVERIFIED_CONTAM: hypothetical protein K2H54_035917 [Gekko kuhli]
MTASPPYICTSEHTLHSGSDTHFIICEQNETLRLLPHGDDSHSAFTPVPNAKVFTVDNSHGGIPCGIPVIPTIPTTTTPGVLCLLLNKNKKANQPDKNQVKSLLLLVGKWQM